MSSSVTCIVYIISLSVTCIVYFLHYICLRNIKCHFTFMSRSGTIACYSYLPHYDHHSDIVSARQNFFVKKGKRPLIQRKN